VREPSLRDPGVEKGGCFGVQTDAGTSTSIAVE
jgi:hypothetical protein